MTQQHPPVFIHLPGRPFCHLLSTENDIRVGVKKCFDLISALLTSIDSQRQNGVCFRVASFCHLWHVRSALNVNSEGLFDFTKSVSYLYQPSDFCWWTSVHLQRRHIRAFDVNVIFTHVEAVACELNMSVHVYFWMTFMSHAASTSYFFARPLSPTWKVYVFIVAFLHHE